MTASSKQVKRRYTVFIQGASSDDVCNWLEPILGGFRPLADVFINERRFQQYETARDALVSIALTEGGGDLLIVKIESRDRPWDDTIACADSVHSALGLAVICDGGLPGPEFMWYVHDAYGQGLIDPVEQAKRH